MINLLNSKKGGGPAVPILGGMALAATIIGVLALLPFLIGGGFFLTKLYDLLFNGKVGEIPMWAVWTVAFLGFILYRRIKG